MSIDTRAGSKQVDAVSMVANQLHVDLSATIKPQAEIDVTKPFNVADHATSVQSSLDESGKKATQIQTIEKGLQQALQDPNQGGSSLGDLGQQRPGGMSRAMGIGLMAGLGFAAPVAGAAMLGMEAIKFATSPVPQVQMHAAEAGPGATPTSFKDPVSRSGAAKEKDISVYDDAMGGSWDFKTGFPANQTRQPAAAAADIDQRQLKMAARNTVGELGAQAVREDLGQIHENKKRIGQQAQEALDESEKIYGVAPTQKFAVAPPNIAGPRGPGFFG